MDEYFCSHCGANEDKGAFRTIDNSQVLCMECLDWELIPIKPMFGRREFWHGVGIR